MDKGSEKAVGEYIGGSDQDDRRLQRHTGDSQSEEEQENISDFRPLKGHHDVNDLVLLKEHQHINARNGHHEVTGIHSLEQNHDVHDRHPLKEHNDVTDLPLLKEHRHVNECQPEEDHHGVNDRHSLEEHHDVNDLLLLKEQYDVNYFPPPGSLAEGDSSDEKGEMAVLCENHVINGCAVEFGRRQSQDESNAEYDVSRQSREWHSLSRVCSPTCEQKAVTSVIVESDNGGVLVPPKKTCLALSISMLVVFIAFNAIQNLQSSINGSLGVISLGIVYVFILVSAPLAPACVELVGGKVIIIISCACYIIYISSNFYPTLATLIPASVILGIAVGGLGTCQGLYLTAAGKSYLIAHKMSKSRLHSVLSLINGFFFMSLQSSHIFGNLIASLILSTSAYNETLMENNTCGASLCPADVDGKSSTIEAPDSRTVNILLGVFLAFPLAGTLIVIFLLPRLPTNMSKNSRSRRWKHLTSCVRMVVTPKYLLLIPLYMAQAMAIINMFTGYTQAFVSCTIGVRWVGYVMISFGISAATFSVIANATARHLGRVPLFIFFILTDISLIVAMLVWQPSHRQEVFVFFIIPALTGVTEGTSQPQFNALIATVFKENEPPAFAAYHFFKCLAFSLFLILSGITCFHHRLYFTLSLYLVALFGYITMEILHKRKQQQNG